jgi:hypothetical protein
VHSRRTACSGRANPLESGAQGGQGEEGRGKVRVGGGGGAGLLLEQLELRLAVVPVAAPPPLRLLELPLLSKGLSARRVHLGAALRRQLRQLHAQLGGLERVPLRLRLSLRHPGLVAPPRAPLGARQGARLPGGRRRRVGAVVRRGGSGGRRAREGERIELLLLERREPRAQPLQQLLLLLEARGVRRLLVELLPRALPPLAHGAEHVRLRRAQQLLELDCPRLRPPRRPFRLAARPLLRLGRLRRLGRLGPLGDQLALQPRRRGLVRRNLGLELGARRREPRLRLLQLRVQLVNRRRSPRRLRLVFGHRGLRRRRLATHRGGGGGGGWRWGGGGGGGGGGSRRLNQLVEPLLARLDLLCLLHPRGPLPLQVRQLEAARLQLVPRLARLGGGHLLRLASPRRLVLARLPRLLSRGRCRALLRQLLRGSLQPHLQLATRGLHLAALAEHSVELRRLECRLLTRARCVHGACVVRAGACMARAARRQPQPLTLTQTQTVDSCSERGAALDDY